MESLLQKVDNITEELKAKDILLARIEVQAKESEKLAKQLSQDLRKQPPALTQDTYPRSDNCLSPDTGHLLPPSSPRLFCLVLSCDSTWKMIDGKYPELKSG